ncbi:hypothetical protein JW872_03425 [Candidatus Babeliales bacterium]|nr:hypothetical protein [Candidatus Babeliales bacterium]
MKKSIIFILTVISSSALGSVINWRQSGLVYSVTCNYSASTPIAYRVSAISDDGTDSPVFDSRTLQQGTKKEFWDWAAPFEAGHGRKATGGVRLEPTPDSGVVYPIEIKMVDNSMIECWTKNVNFDDGTTQDVVHRIDIADCMKDYPEGAVWDIDIIIYTNAVAYISGITRHSYDNVSQQNYPMPDPPAYLGGPADNTSLTVCGASPSTAGTQARQTTMGTKAVSTRGLGVNIPSGIPMSKVKPPSSK